MTRDEEKLILVLGLLERHPQAIVLQGFIQQFGPLSEEAGKAVREILARTDK